MPVPYLFATTPGNGTIPLANLDANFAYLLNSPTLNNLIVSGSTSLNGPILFGGQLIPGVTGTNLMVLNTSPTLITPNLGTPTYLNLVNAINLPIGSITGFGANIEAFLINPNSATLAYAVSDETGTGLLVFNNTPTLTTPLINNPQVSSGSFQAPTMVSPILGTPASGNLQNCTGYSVSNITGTGPGVITALQAAPNNVSGIVTYNGSAGNLTAGAISVASTSYRGSTSGSITVQAPASPGVQAITWPAASGTVLLDSTVVGIAAGVITFYPASAPPAGWLVCNGSSYPTASYPALFAVIGYTYGGSGGNFNVPNLSGLFVRGVGGNSAPLGVVQYDSFASHTHTVNDPGHSHTINDPTHGHLSSPHAHQTTLVSGSSGQGAYWGRGIIPTAPPYGQGNLGVDNTKTLTLTSPEIVTINNNSTGITINTNTTGITNYPTGSIETRPVNMALLPIIKF